MTLGHAFKEQKLLKIREVSKICFWRGFMSYFNRFTAWQICCLTDLCACKPKVFWVIRCVDLVEGFVHNKGEKNVTFVFFPQQRWMVGLNVSLGNFINRVMWYDFSDKAVIWLLNIKKIQIILPPLHWCLLAFTRITLIYSVHRQSRNMSGTQKTANVQKYSAMSWCGIIHAIVPPGH